MKVRLKVLPNKPRGAAWPSSARAVRCPVKSGNEQDLHPQLQTRQFDERAQCGDRIGNNEEGAGNDRSVWPESPGLHARHNGMDRGIQLRKEKSSLETMSWS